MEKKSNNNSYLSAEKNNYYVNMPIWNEQGHNISYKITCVPNEDSDQSAHLRSLIWVFAGHSVG